jgi:hypothetical protein
MLDIRALLAFRQLPRLVEGVSAGAAHVSKRFWPNRLLRVRLFRSGNYTSLARLKRAAARAVIAVLIAAMMAMSKPRSQRTRPDARAASANDGSDAALDVAADKTMMRSPSTP